MRIVIQLSENDMKRRRRMLVKDPDAHTDHRAQDLGLLLWRDAPGGYRIEGVDLADSSGQYLYTIVGDER